LVSQLFSELKLEGIELRLNTLGSRNCRRDYQDALKVFLHQVRDKLCDDCVRRMERNPLRALDCKKPGCMEATREAPVILDFLSPESRGHFEQVQAALKDRKILFKMDPRMVRGLDYYEHTVFEFVTAALGAQNAVAAGGRYNDLVADLGGPKIPAVGFALGMERLVSIIPLERHEETKRPRIYLIGLDQAADHFFFSRTQELRALGAVVQLDLGGASLKNKLKRAARWQADWAVIQGEEERDKGAVILRDMQGSSQETILTEELLSKLSSKFPNAPLS
jgi:histidyl-tRNA synthetase